MTYIKLVMMFVVVLLGGVGCFSTKDVAGNKAKALAIRSGKGISDFKIIEVYDAKGDSEIKHVIYGSFVAETGLGAVAKIRVPFAIPFNKYWEVYKKANNMVFHCPYVCEYKFFQKKRPRHRWFLEEKGYSFFSLHLLHKDYYSVEESKGFGKFVFSLKQQLEKWYGLKSKNLLMTGESAGPYMATSLLKKYPNKIDGAAYVGGYETNFDDSSPKFKDSRAALLALFTVGAGFKAIKIKEHKRIQLLCAVTPPKWRLKDNPHMHHAPGKEAWDLMHLFIAGLVTLREQNGGVLPHYKNWPIKEDTFLETQNGAVKKTLYFPSKEFKRKWDSLPIAMFTKLHYHPELLLDGVVIPPKQKNPKKIILFVNDPQLDMYNHLTTKDNLYYFALKNVVSSAVQLNAYDNEGSIERIKVFLKKLMKRKEWGNIPIIVVGVGVGGESAAKAALSLSKDKKAQHQIEKIVTINSQLSKFAHLCHKDSLPITYILSSNYIPQYRRVETSNTTVVELEDISCFSLGLDWYSVIDKYLNLN